MSAQFYYLLHVIGGFLLTAFTILATATAANGKRKGLMALTGILSLVVLVGGFGLIAKVYSNTWPAWVHPKIACWLVLSMASGLAMRKPSTAGLWTGVSVASVVIAVVMVYVRPF